MESRTVASSAALRRTTDDRVVAGVCGGVAERLKIDAVAVRVLFVLGAMVWGVTVVIYAAMWRWVRTEDSPTRNPVRPGRLPSLGLAAGVIAFMAAAMLSLRSLGLLPPDVVVLPLSLAALGVMFVWAGQPLRPIDRPALGAVADEPDGRTEDSPDGRYRFVPAAEDPFTVDPQPEPQPSTEPERQRAPFGSVLVGAVVLVACLGFLLDRSGWVDVQWRLLGAGLLVAIGVVLIGGSTRGRPPGLMGLGLWLLLALVAATIFQVPLGSGVGARTLHPLSLEDVETRLAGGSLVVDLSDYVLDPEAPTPVLETSVAVGDLRVVVPAGVEVDVFAQAGLGAVTVFSEGFTGMGVERHFVSSGFTAAPGQLRVVAEVGVGRVIVEQAR